MYDDNELEYVGVVYRDNVSPRNNICLYKDTKTGVEYFVTEKGGICKRELI